MTKDNYQKWELGAESTDGLYFFELHDQAGSLIIFLKKFELPNKVLKIQFEGVLAYKIIAEAGRLRFINDNWPLNTFSQSTNSAFLRELYDESGGIFEDSELIHYVICNSDNIIDVISGPPVLAEWLEI